MNRLLCLGFGYSAKALVTELPADNWQVAGTRRTAGRSGATANCGAEIVYWDGDSYHRELGDKIDEATHVLVSIPPDAGGDIVLRHYQANLAGARSLEWLGYLSSTSVYGDHGGGKVSELTPANPSSERGQRRCRAEKYWLALHETHDLPVHCFRLAGIYGPERNQIAALRNGTARLIAGRSQKFNRIHVADVAACLRQSIGRLDPGNVYNVCDDLPASQAEVVRYAAELISHPLPPEVSLDSAQLSAIGRSFYGESKHVSNQKIKSDLEVVLRYPDYRAGLRAIVNAEDRNHVR